MLLIVCTLILAAVMLWGCQGIMSELRASRDAAKRMRVLRVLGAFAQAPGAAAADPRAVLVWEPLARAARQLFPDEFEQLDRASGSAFPLGADRIQAAHAQWTADWLAWERTHDAEYKLKAAAAEEELAQSGGSAVLRSRL